MRYVVALALALESAAEASPNVPLDDPAYTELDQLDLSGNLGPYAGGVAPLTETRVRELLGQPALASTFWSRAVERATLRENAFWEDDRPFSTPRRPRDLDGVVALSCEHAEGRPCGEGQGLVSQLDSSAGYGPWAAAAVRLRATTGTGGYGNDLAIERAYANAEVGPALFELGRDVLALGPSSRTSLAWSDSAAPLDQLRLQTARPLPLADRLRGNVLYVVGQRRDTSELHPPLVTITRAQLDIANAVELALHQELMIGGDGVPSLGIWDFISEHFRRRDASAGPSDSSNRRFGGDVAIHVRGARLYYAIVFEDIRKHVIDAVHYDADHLLGVELALPGYRRAVLIELQRTGVRSYEHLPAITQFTSAERIVGSPLGPDAFAIFVGGRLFVHELALTPWIELVRLSSDTYEFVDHGPILHTEARTPEDRYRLGGRARYVITPQIRAEAELSCERVTNVAFEPGANRNNIGLLLTMTWQPGGLLTQ